MTGGKTWWDPKTLIGTGKVMFRKAEGQKMEIEPAFMSFDISGMALAFGDNLIFP